MAGRLGRGGGAFRSSDRMFVSLSFVAKGVFWWVIVKGEIYSIKRIKLIT